MVKLPELWKALKDEWYGGLITATEFFNGAVLAGYEKEARDLLHMCPGAMR